jgi:hypothetical protein
MATTDIQNDKSRSPVPRALITGNGDPIDLLVLIDGSDVMFDAETKPLDAAIVPALKQAIADCPCKLYANFFGIQGPAKDKRSQLKNFQDTLVDFLLAQGVQKDDLKERGPGVTQPADAQATDGEASDLGRAVVDAATHYQWIPGAKRHILVIGDEGWSKGNRDETGTDNDWKTWVDSAAVAAKQAHIAVDTYRILLSNTATADDPITRNEYEHVAKETGGDFWGAETKGTDINWHVGQMVCGWTGKIGDPLGQGPGPASQPHHGTLGHGPAGDPYGGHPPHGHGPAGDPYGGHPPHGHGPAGDPYGGHPPHGHGPAGDPYGGHPPHGHGPAGDPYGGHPPHGHGPAGDPYGGHPPHGPGPVVNPPSNGTTTLCDELPGVLKTICSVTTLLHKVVDACYPPSQWPASAYPDGCGDLGKRGGKGKSGCGCGGHGGAHSHAHRMPETAGHPGPVIGGQAENPQAHGRPETAGNPSPIVSGQMGIPHLLAAR